MEYVCVNPRRKDSMYHALGHSSILVMQATMTFEQRDIQAAMVTIKEALNTCQRSHICFFFYFEPWFNLWAHSKLNTTWEL